MKCINCIRLYNGGGFVIHDAVTVVGGNAVCLHHLVRDHLVQQPTPEGRQKLEAVVESLS